MGSSTSKKIKLKENFELDKYLGTWFEAYRSKSISFEKNEGFYDKYTMNNDGTVNVLTGYYNEIKDSVVTMNGTAGFNGPRGWVKFAWFLPKGDYKILETDYTNFTIIHSFNQFGCLKYEWVWILTREKVISKELSDKCFQILEERIPHLKIENFHKTIQNDGIIKYPKEL